MTTWGSDVGVISEAAQSAEMNLMTLMNHQQKKGPVHEMLFLPPPTLLFLLCNMLIHVHYTLFKLRDFGIFIVHKSSNGWMGG